MVKKSEVALMNKRAVAFFLANPVPEMLPEDAKAAGAEIVATGRSDYPNQVNNSLLFPAVFRGALDVRAKTITDAMVIAASRGLAEFATKGGLTKEHIIPTMVEWEVYPHVAAIVGQTAIKEGQARKKLSRKESLEVATEVIGHARRTMDVLRKNGIILEPPE
jgi:malic enzyme